MHVSRQVRMQAGAAAATAAVQLQQHQKPPLTAQHRPASSGLLPSPMSPLFWHLMQLALYSSHFASTARRWAVWTTAVSGARAGRSCPNVHAASSRDTTQAIPPPEVGLRSDVKPQLSPLPLLSAVVLASSNMSMAFRPILSSRDQDSPKPQARYWDGCSRHEAPSARQGASFGFLL